MRVDDSRGAGGWMTGAAEQLAVYEHIADVPSGWEGVVRQGSLFMQPSLLNALEQTAAGASRRRYLVYEGESGTGVATAELLQTSSARNPVASQLLGRVHQSLPGFGKSLLPMLLLRTDLSSDPPIVAAPNTGKQRLTLLCEMLAAIERYAAGQGWTLGMVGVPLADAQLAAALSRRGYLSTLGRPYAELRLGYGSWDQYVDAAARHNKGAAQNIRYEVNRARREALSIDEWSPDSVPESTLYSLLATHHRRLNSSDFEYASDFLTRLTAALGDRIRILVAVLGGEVQGVTVFAWTGLRGYVMFVGMLEKARRAGFAYFNLVYYEPIRRAIALGLGGIGYGQAVFPAKIRRGCTAHATGIYLRPRSSLASGALRGLLMLHRPLMRAKYADVLEAAPFASLS